ncbi:MAG: lysine--tRNA ligase [Candidatus Promineifilaceae bacterium]
MSWEANRLEQNRLDKLARIKEAGIAPYPTSSDRSHTSAEAIAAFDEAAETQPTVTIVGRLMSMRDMGKTVFAHVEDGFGRIQLFMRRKDVTDPSHRNFRKLLDLGDFVQATGVLFKTRTGEVSVRVGENGWKLLAKAISPLPQGKSADVDGETVHYSAFANVEDRYRQRYADLAVNADVRDIFIKRAGIVRSMRRFMDDAGFLEVETPILQPIYGGAAAKPFTTHHNQLKQELYLRISFELYLKRLLVGGIEKVYEIGRDFRNEGVSWKHNPEFTQMEFYAAYWDFRDVAAHTEAMVKYIAKEVNGTTMIQFGGHEIDLDQPWTYISMRDAIKKWSGIDYMDHTTADSLRAAMRANGAEAPTKATWGKLIDQLFSDYVEPKLIQPTFIIDYPRDISPLAKRKPGDDFHVERFEYFIAGMEMGNAFTELNDPIDQQQRFEDMQAMYGDDEEGHPMDWDYLRAMRYGMPPNGGFGTGIDRLTMLLTGKDSIREVLLFPHLRDRTDE